MYNLEYTDTGEKTKTITRGTFGAGQELQFTVKDENGSAVDLTDVTTVMKIYVGVEGTLQIDGETVAIGTATSGTCTYALQSTDFDAEEDAGSYAVELEFSDNAITPTKQIRAGKASLKVIDTISD